jgi:hypothetical protein
MAVKLSEETKAVEGGTTTLYGRVCKVLPRAKENIFIALNDLQSGYLYQKMIAPLLCPLSFHSGIMLKLT